MRNVVVVVVLLSSLGLAACSEPNQEVKSAADPWSDFKGTYSASAPKEETSEDGEPAKKEAKGKPSAKHEPAEDAAASTKRGPSKGTVNGESLSSVDVDVLTDVSKSALKARMLEYFRQVEQTGEELIVTDNNRPVLKVVPIVSRQPASSVFADVRGRVVYHEDLLAPTLDEWTDT